MLLKKRHWIWLFYLIVLSFLVIHQAIRFFDPNSDIYLYFLLLRYFDKLFYFNYTLNIIQTLMHALLIIPVVLFIFRIPSYSPKIWQFFFIFKIIFDIFGNSYPQLELISIYKENKFNCIFILLFSNAIYIPAYLAVYFYAFKYREVIDEKV